MLRLRFRRCVLIVFASAATALPALTLAAANFEPLSNYSGTPLQSVYQSNSLATYFNALFRIALSVGAILAVIRLVWAGYKYMGTDMWSEKGEAKGIIKDVIWGMLLLLGTYLILHQINPQILNLDILQRVKSVQQGNQTTTAPPSQPSPFTAPPGYNGD